MAARNSYVCFEFDTDHSIYGGEQGCDWGMEFSSVVGYGRISVVGDDLSRKSGIDCIMKKYSGSDSFSYDPKVLARTTILKLEIEEMTGKRK